MDEEKVLARCDSCGCAFAPEPKVAMEGDTGLIWIQCTFCGKRYLAAASDEELRKQIREYAALAEQNKKKRLPERAQRRMQRLKERCAARSAELKEQYLKEHKQEEGVPDGQ